MDIDKSMDIDKEIVVFCPYKARELINAAIADLEADVHDPIEDMMPDFNVFHGYYCYWVPMLETYVSHNNEALILGPEDQLGSVNWASSPMEHTGVGIDIERAKTLATQYSMKKLVLIDKDEVIVKVIDC